MKQSCIIMLSMLLASVCGQSKLTNAVGPKSKETQIQEPINTKQITFRYHSRLSENNKEMMYGEYIVTWDKPLEQWKEQRLCLGFESDKKRDGNPPEIEYTSFYAWTNETFKDIRT